MISPSLASLRSGELAVLRATGEAGSPSALFFLLSAEGAAFGGKRSRQNCRGRAARCI